MNESGTKIIVARLDLFKTLERDLVKILFSMMIIEPGFTGSLTLHFNEGGLSEIDKVEKNLRKKLICDNR